MLLPFFSPSNENNEEIIILIKIINQTKCFSFATKKRSELCCSCLEWSFVVTFWVKTAQRLELRCFSHCSIWRRFLISYCWISNFFKVNFTDFFFYVSFLTTVQLWLLLKLVILKEQNLSSSKSDGQVIYSPLTFRHLKYPFEKF